MGIMALEGMVRDRGLNYSSRRAVMRDMGVEEERMFMRLRQERRLGRGMALLDRWTRGGVVVEGC